MTNSIDLSDISYSQDDVITITSGAQDTMWGWGNIASPTYTVTGATGSPGSVLTSNGSAYNWATVSVDPNLQGNTLQVNGAANISGELTVQGVNLSDRLDRIEEKLAILRPNEEMEAKWENLRGLRKAYMELEAEIKEKEAMWGILKK